MFLQISKQHRGVAPSGRQLVDSTLRSSLNPTVLGEEKAQSKLCHLWVSSKSQKLVAVNQNASHHKVPTQQQKQLLLLTPPTIFSICCFLSHPPISSVWLDLPSLITARHLHSVINVFVFLLLPLLSTLQTPVPTLHPPLSSSPHLAEQQRPSAGPVAWRSIPTANLISRNQGTGVRTHFGRKLLNARVTLAEKPLI